LDLSQTDIWSLAVMIFELAALEKPFDANFLPMLVFKVTRGEVSIEKSFFLNDHIFC